MPIALEVRPMEDMGKFEWVDLYCQFFFQYECVDLAARSAIAINQLLERGWLNPP